MPSHVLSIFAHPELYLDPGSGSLIVQLLLAAFLGVGITIRLFWKRITTFFNRSKSIVTPSVDEEDDQ
jgi:hypothetical protein